jgi:hypothetical protein
MALTKASYSMVSGAPLNVLDYGADPTGVSDSTTAIQRAFDDGAVAIYFPQGDYLCGGLTVPAYIQRIYGEGTLLANANNVVIMQVLTDVSRRRTKDIDGLRFSGNGKTNATGLKLGSVTNNPAPGAQEAVLYVAMRDTHFSSLETGVDSRVSMEHCFENIVFFQNTVGMKLYSDVINGGCNANTFIALRFEQNTVGCMVVSNSIFPLHNNIFLGCIWQSNAVCGLFTQGMSGTGNISGISVKGFHIEGNGYGASTVTIDGIVVKRADFYFIQSTISLEDSSLSSRLSPCVLAETASHVVASNLTGYGNTFGEVYAPDATSQVSEFGLSVSLGVKYIETYGVFESIGTFAAVGSPKMNLGLYRNDSTMTNPAIPTLNNTTGAVAVTTQKNTHLGLMSSIQFAASSGSTATNRNYWYNGDGIPGEYFFLSVICMTDLNTTIRFQNLLSGAFNVFDVNFVANTPRRVIIGGRLATSTGLSNFIFPMDSVGATMFFKAHTYVSTADLTVINNVYQNGLCGLKTLNYEQLSAAPTTGTWARNEAVWNSSSAAGQPPGWVCVTAGTPGTWKAMANLAS